VEERTLCSHLEGVRQRSRRGSHHAIKWPVYARSTTWSIQGPVSTAVLRDSQAIHFGMRTLGSTIVSIVVGIGCGGRERWRRWAGASEVSGWRPALDALSDDGTSADRLHAHGPTIQARTPKSARFV